MSRAKFQDLFQSSVRDDQPEVDDFIKSTLPAWCSDPDATADRNHRAGLENPRSPFRHKFALKLAREDDVLCADGKWQQRELSEQMSLARFVNRNHATLQQR